MKVLINRIEGKRAFLRPLHQVVGDEDEYRVWVEDLPLGHAPGDIIEIAFLPDPARREDLRRGVKELLDSLPNKQGSTI